MRRILPAGLAPAAYSRAITAFSRIVGSQWVLNTDEDRDTYLDIYAPGDEALHAPSGAVAPASTEEIQAVLRVANEFKIPLWPISRGKNMGYGGAAPVMAGTMVLDLSRMTRILDVDEKLGVARLEPGVGFFQLHEHLTANKIPLWLSLPGNAWGSVIGNALERGFAATPYGEHSSSLCGLEVVLPTGELVRTGMGAMNRAPTASLFRYGFGPSWDQLFCQSNFGVVTQAGVWLMPEPEATATLSMALPQPEDLGWAIDLLTKLRLARVLEHSVGIASYMGSATVRSQRREWYDGPGALPDGVVQAMLKKYGVGWWNFTLRLYGVEGAVAANRKAIEDAFARHTKQPFRVGGWRKGDARPGAPSPSVLPLQIVNWHGGRGGHIGFSPVMPADGKLVLEQLARTRKRYAEFGQDFSATFYQNVRHVTNVNLILYNRDDDEQTGRVRKLFDALVSDAHANGYGEYRTHISYMDKVAGTFDWNGHALGRLNERLKDMLDPNGVLAPGKSGIWGSARRPRPAAPRGAKG